MTNAIKRSVFSLIGLLLPLLLLGLPPAAAEANVPAVSGSFLYRLSSFTGAIPFNSVSLAFDRDRNEVYVCDPGQNSVQIFNEQGMEVFRFGDSSDLGVMLDLAVLDDGDILLLSYPSLDREPVLVRCNYRGEPLRQVRLRGLPADFGRFRPTKMVLRQGRLYLVDLNAMLVAVADPEGEFLEGHDLVARLGLERNDVDSFGIGGFDLDADGNFLFTVPVQFMAYRMAPDGTLQGFGQPGSSPGRFGVVAGIAGDSRGNIYVVDTLRCVVMVFNRELRFQNEFGVRGIGPGGLIAPRDLVVAADERVYVTQNAKMGVSVFRIGD